MLRPNGVLAVWCYDLMTVGDRTDAIVETLDRDIVGPHWPGERRFVEERYSKIEFPFDELDVPDFHMSAEWSIDHLLGFLATWSSVKRYREIEGRNPLEMIESKLREAWKGHGARTVRWPLYFRVGRA